MIALDTNILVYAAGKGDLRNRDNQARDLLDRLAPVPIVVSLQVLGEFLSVCRRKQILSLNVATLSVDLWLNHYVCPATTPVDLAIAADLSGRFDLQYFDSLIIAVARRAGTTILLSEDMHDGMEVDGLRVVNPFVAGNDAVIAAYLAKS